MTAPPIASIHAQLNKALMDSDGWMDGLLVQLQDGVLILDAERQILAANQASADLLGRRIEELRGAAFTRLPNHLQWGESATRYHNQDAVLVTFRRVEVPVVESHIPTMKELLESGMPMHYRISYPDDVLLEIQPIVTNASGVPLNKIDSWVHIWRSTLHPNDASRVLTNLKMLKVRGSVDLVYRVISPSGKIHWVQDTSSLVPTDDGQVERRGMLCGINNLERMGELAIERGQREKQILNALPDLVFVLDKHGRFIDLKINQLEYTKEPPGLYNGRYLRDILPVEDEESALQIIHNALQSGQILETEFHWNGIEGARAYDVWAVQLDQDRVLALLRDITERRRMEQELRSSEEFLRGVLESQNEMIVRVDPNGHFTFVNDAYCHMFGKTRDELLSGAFMPLVHPDDLPETLHLMEMLSEPPYRIYVEQRAMTVNGWRWLSWEDYAIRDAHGNIQEIQGVGRDIHEQKMALQLLQEAKDSAEKANRAKSAFLSTMSHEIRTPLNSIVGMTSLLKETVLSDEQRDYVETTRSSSEALLAIINNILDFSKIESSKLELEQQPFNVHDCVQEVVDWIAPMAAGKGIDLAYMIDSGVPEIVSGDVTRLRQVLVNLLGNAVKFTQTGEVVVTLSGRAENGNCELTFHVRDTGIGIPADRVPQLFEPFTQADTSTTRRFGGSGLGLAISQRLVELMGGKIWVDSEVDRGSTFHFSICTGVTEPMQNSGLEQPLLENAASVLVFSDSPATRQMIMRLLEGWKMHSSAAASLVEASAVLQRTPEMKIVILDVNTDLEKEDCVCQLLQKRFPDRLLEWIVLHPLGARPVIRGGLRLRGLFSKPIRQSQLFNTLVEILHTPSYPTEKLVAQAQPIGEAQNGMHILLVEDNVVNQKVALRMLEKLGWHADLATDGLEALEALERKDYQLVLMDVLMPEMDGVEATRRIRARFPGERQPVIIAMTANALEGERERYLAAGMDDYVSKPVTLNQLQSIIQRLNLNP